MAAVLLATAALADDGTAGSADPERAQVRAVLDAGTLALSDDRRVRLAQVRPPDAWRDDTAMVDRATAALSALVLDREIVMRFPGPRFDRYGRLVARVELPDGTWVQGRLVEQGWAMVASDEDHLQGLKDLLARETDARTAARGMWGDWRYRVLDPISVTKVPDGYRVVEGRVEAVASVGAWTYLNFGADWREDFTVSIHRRDRRRIEAELGALTELAGRQVRVRGWVRRFNGPMIEATYPQQIEPLE